MTMAMGVLFWFVVPDNQLNARFLNERDRALAVLRIRKNEQGVGNTHWKKYQFIEALTDPLTWAFVFYALVADIPNGLWFSEIPSARVVGCSTNHIRVIQAESPTSSPS